MRILLFGDKTRAAQFIPRAKAILFSLKKIMSAFPDRRQGSDLRVIGDTEIEVSSISGADTILITSKGGALIICHVGTTTYDLKKKFFDLNGNAVSSAAWKLIDDGLYYAVWDGEHDDPMDYEYVYEYPGGARIPEVSSGIAAKQQSGRSARYILNNTPEDELYQGFAWGVSGPGYSYTYNFLQLDDSLIFAPYKCKGAKPFVSRYVDDGVVTLKEIWAGYDVVFFFQAYESDNFIDNIPQVRRIYYDPLKATAENPRRYVSVLGDGAVAAVCNYYADKRLTQNLERMKTFDVSGNDFAEPIAAETYDIDAATSSEGDSLPRSSDPDDHEVWFVDGDIISGKVYDPVTKTVTNSGLSTIADDIKIPYAVLEDGSMTYVRKQKDTQMTQFNCGLYVAGTLVEESGLESVIKLFDDTSAPVAPAVDQEINGCPIYIRKTNYRILHAHHDKDFNVCVYRKTVYVSHSSELLPYTVNRTGIGQVQLRKTTVDSLTTYAIAVNGVVYPLTGYQSVNHEYQVTALGEPYTGPALDQITGGIIPPRPWCDIDEDSVNITRIFTTAGKDKILINIDAYPANWTHELQRNLHGAFYNLEAVYQGPQAFPPSSDGSYEFPQAREWLLFNKDGSLLRKITPPKFKAEDGSMKNWQRVNGLCLLEA